MTPLCELARKYRTDKGGQHLTYGNHPTELCHNYTPMYHAMFTHFRDQVQSVVEIGVNQGCSLRMWQEYFPKAKIFGLDIDGSCLFGEERIACYHADQSDPVSLLRAFNAIRNELYDAYIDVIIDDGSHILEHQIISMKTLLPLLSHRGVYIVEDCPAQDIDRLKSYVPENYEAHVIPCPGGLGNARQDEKLLAVIRG